MAIVESTINSLFDGVRRTDVSSRIFPSVGRVELVLVNDDTGSVGNGDVCFRGFWFLLVTGGTGTEIRGMVPMRCSGKDGLEVVFLQGNVSH
jgi:hypothetical protein